MRPSCSRRSPHTSSAIARSCSTPPGKRRLMLKTRLLHPAILEALGEAGHGSQVLIADGNYPLLTRSHERAHRVFLNLAPDLLRVTDVLGVISEAIPIEAAHVMTPDT